MSPAQTDQRTPILYLAPWVDYGGTDKGTIDWFRWIDRERFAPSLMTTQPSPNRRLAEVAPYAEEIWALPDLVPAEHMPKLIFDFIHSRGVKVLHLMNSRLAYDLLPDLGCLPDPPKVVVQLHVEEADRSGYVRYVTTRYGNLVDGFSVTSEHLADAVQEYGVERDKISVIFTGVDAEEEFSPSRVTPIQGLPGDGLRILYPGRLVEQKDPLTMVEVAGALRDRGVRFQLHVVGEGELEGDVRERTTTLGLDDRISFHPATRELERWYAACDALLMTSVFEGVPYVIFEAMAMGIPVVAPALPGNRELLDPDGLIEPRDSVDAYAAALERLAEDETHRAALGRDLRSRVRERFSLQRMAADHGALYDRLLESEDEAEAKAPVPPAPPIRFVDRPLHGFPLVSVLVPHFNQGRFLGECIDSIRAQTYPAVETIVVDDASSGSESKAVLEQLEAADDVTLVRLDANGGPSRARNVGIDHCSGRYVLPVDADNVLLPDALERLVEQLSAAGEEIGFVYPNLQFFGNREDYFEAPEYNLHELTRANYCDTCSLFDRQIFDAGERYLEDIRVGHEDWEFVLRLAARGVRGEAAHGPTLRYRKWGFNRSDAVEYAPELFHEVLAEISPFKHFAAEVKAMESPTLSMMLLEPIDASSEGARRLGERIVEQSCIDVEVIARFDGPWPARRDVPQVLGIPTGLAGDACEALRQARSVARGSILAATSETGNALFADPAFVEKVLRRFAIYDDSEIDAIALIDAGEDGRFSFCALDPGDGPAEASAHTVVWRLDAEDVLPKGLHADVDEPVGSIARLLAAAGAKVEWRHMPLQERAARPGASGNWAPLPAPARGRPSNDGSRTPPPDRNPLLPGAQGLVPRWWTTPTWTPPQSILLCRHREIGGQRRVVTNDRRSPDGFEAEWDLGLARLFAFQGTTRLVRLDDDYAALPRGEWASTPDAQELGYLELAPFPLLDAIALAVHRPTGQRTLVVLTGDPLLGDVDVIRGLGYVEPFPIRPRRSPETERPVGLTGLTKAVDYGSRRHRYAVGGLPEGQLVGELGALASIEMAGSHGAWIADGRLFTEQHRPAGRRPGARTAIRWSGAPVVWRDVSAPAAKARALARRSVEAASLMVAPPKRESDPYDAPPAGWLYGSPGSGRTPLYAAYHPVTGDQLLTRSQPEATRLGYVSPELLGFLRTAAPVTGTLDQRSLAIPWASRFGVSR